MKIFIVRIFILLFYSTLFTGVKSASAQEHSELLEKAFSQRSAKLLDAYIEQFRLKPASAGDPLAQTVSAIMQVFLPEFYRDSSQRGVVQSAFRVKNARYLLISDSVPVSVMKTLDTLAVAIANARTCLADSDACDIPRQQVRTFIDSAHSQAYQRKADYARYAAQLYRPGVIRPEHAKVFTGQAFPVKNTLKVIWAPEKLMDELRLFYLHKNFLAKPVAYVYNSEHAEFLKKYLPFYQDGNANVGQQFDSLDFYIRIFDIYLDAKEDRALIHYALGATVQVTALKKIQGRWIIQSNEIVMVHDNVRSGYIRKFKTLRNLY